MEIRENRLGVICQKHHSNFVFKLELAYSFSLLVLHLCIFLTLIGLKQFLSSYNLYVTDTEES